MFQISVNGVVMPIIYWSLGDAIKACKLEAERGVAVCTDIISL